ncbi:hypothetical protein IW140_001706 [Coemansia sp. RSA 1813]|nr:hypothetical protein LPJ74_001418 [Coemansia sp. RSA 1843]KAJ2214012.1 hypothetical protein EV179_003367 [Coemansia sp. RSA 487]KAJ2571252.1 hypothetical protein IW140_001706 [Coemansia sp. RSA 1813]
MLNVPYLTSCNHCREKKRKCNGERPVCSLCRAHRVRCEYRQSRRFRKRFQDEANRPLLSIMPVPGNSNQQNPVSPGSSRPLATASNPQSANGSPANTFQGSNAFIPPTHNTPPQTTQNQPLPATLPSEVSEVNALCRLLAGNMHPQTQQLPQPISQGVNMFMSPFPDPRTRTLPKWLSQFKPEAAIISNLENIASAYPAYSASPMLPMQAATTPDNILFGNLTSQFMPNGSVFQHVPPFPIDIQQQQQQQMPYNGMTGNPVDVMGVSSGPMASALGIPSMLGQVTASPVCSAIGGSDGIYVPAPLSVHTTQAQPFGDGFVPARRSSSRSSSHISTARDSVDMGKVTSPSVGPHLVAVSSHYNRSPSIGAVSDSPTSIGALLPISEQNDGNGGQALLSGDTSESRKRKRQTHSRQQQNRKPAQYRQQNERRAPVHYPDDFIPEIIQTYAREFPGKLSAGVLLKVMRGICSNTRTSLVNIDLEISWCMILKGIIPRILLFAYIASMARGQAIDQELMLQLPANFDETCYEIAAKDIPLALASPSLWGALSLHLIGRYEFQSSRYDLMLKHYEMATEILTKTTFHGYPFPWINVPEKLKHTFEYDYYVYTFWVGFQWHLVCCFNLDRPFNVDIGLQSLPLPTSMRGYFAPDLPCGFDLLTLLPDNCWPRSAQTEKLDKVWYCGFNDPEYDGWRPSEWNKISPNYKITVQLQRMLPLGAQLYRLQCDFCEGKLTLSNYLQRLHTQQELLKRWLYSLPEEFEITQDKVNQFTSAAVNRQESSIETFNMVMDFKELIMIYGLYSSFMVRANRVALLGMLNKSLKSPATSMHMHVFGLRDYFEAVEKGVGDVDYGSDEYDMWQKNLAFHKCRMQCYESMSILCDVVQLSFVLRLNLFTYGTTYVAIAGEMLNVLISQLGIQDKNVKWKTKTRLAHVLCLLRSLQHWAPAIYLFVYGIQLLSDPYILLDENVAANSKRESNAAPSRENNVAVAKSPPRSNELNGTSLNQECVDYNDTNAGSEAPMEIPNPFRRNHIINLIVDDLDMSLSVFLAPAYPMLLLKIFASSNI